MLIPVEKTNTEAWEAMINDLESPKGKHSAPSHSLKWSNGLS